MTGFAPSDAQRFENALRRFAEVNSRDPNQEWAGGRARPRELQHAQWLSHWVLALCPQASEELRLASHCQHLCRWLIPRDSRPLTRGGYLTWRADLKKLHAEKAGEILAEVGYPQPVIQRVQALVLKKDFPADPESRVLEDALCLVFLEHQFSDLAGKTAPEKMIRILQKTWAKMSPTGRTAALGLSFTPEQKALLERALASGAAAEPVQE